MSKITDHFKVGDRVKWIKVTCLRNGWEVKQLEGVIDTIVGSKAMVKSPDFKRRKRVSLFELEVINVSN